MIADECRSDESSECKIPTQEEEAPSLESIPDGNKLEEHLTKLSFNADTMLREHKASLQKCLDTWSSRQEQVLTSLKSQLELVEKALSGHANPQQKELQPKEGGQELFAANTFQAVNSGSLADLKPGGARMSIAPQVKLHEAPQIFKAGPRASIAQQGSTATANQVTGDSTNPYSLSAASNPNDLFMGVAQNNTPRKGSKRLSKAISPMASCRSSTVSVATDHAHRYGNFTASKMHDDALFERTKTNAIQASEVSNVRSSKLAGGGIRKQGSLLAPYSVVSGPVRIDPLKPEGMNPDSKKQLSRIVSGIKHSVARLSVSKGGSARKLQTVSSGGSDEEPLHDLHILETMRTSVKSLTFDMICGCCIFLNAAVIGIETDFMVDRHEDSSGFFAVQMIFNVWYLLELTLRVWADRFRFFSSKDWKWNVFDMALVSISVIELLLEILNMRGFAVMGRLMRSIRIVRVVRTLRIVRVLRYVREFRKMIFSIAASMQTLFWSLLLLGVMMYIFAVLFTQAVSQYRRDLEDGGEEAPSDFDNLKDAFGSLSRSVYSLYMAISGGINWGLVAKPLMILHWSFVLFFLTFITVCVFGVLNVVTSVFVESAMQSANHYRDLLIQEKMYDKEMYVKHMREVFKQIDKDGNDEISFEEVEMFLKDKNLRMYLEALEIDLVETHSLFRLLDKDGSGFIDIDEFCEGCLRLKGDAKSFDIHCLLYENQRMLTKWTQFMDFVEAEFFHLSTGVRWSVAHGESNGRRSSMDGPRRSMEALNEPINNRFVSKVLEEDESSLSHSLNPTNLTNSADDEDASGVNPYGNYPQHPKHEKMMAPPGRVVLD